MFKRLLFATILAVASGGAFAQASSSTTGGEGNTGGTETDTGAPQPRRGAQTNDRRGNAPIRSESPRASQPRWHSFLPGMFR